MEKRKYFIVLIILIGLFFLLTPNVFPENSQIKNLSEIASQSEIVIIFNSGGWGDTPLEKAKDFAPIIQGIQQTLNNWGMKSIVIPYQRTKNGFLGRITGAKEFFLSFRDEANELANKINLFLKENPQKRVIITGLSNGGAFAEKTMEKISDKVKDRVYSIEAGVPFWKKKIYSENILRLDNFGQDPLAKGELRVLFSTLIKTPFRWLLAKVKKENLSLSQAIHIPGHDYSWQSPKLRFKIISFLEQKFINQ